MGHWIGNLDERRMEMGIRQHIDRYLSGFSATLLEKNQRFHVDPIDLVRDDLAEFGACGHGYAGKPEPARYYYR